jgi:hypothetical protein
MAKNYNPFTEDPTAAIKNSTDVEFLKSMLEKWIPMDRSNIEKGNNKDVHEHMGIDHEKWKEGQIKLCDLLESAVKKRLEELK